MNTLVFSFIFLYPAFFPKGFKLVYKKNKLIKKKHHRGEKHLI